ncbi:MAG TPA: 2-C-methyl-D-erythritol 4-phosphate cytidylyltransferase [Spirochaeta sp.]|nr:2-C-methyl-D-erythritol 4-phosphate cytidylyltransferase [Spirochaeta sp.]
MIKPSAGNRPFAFLITAAGSGTRMGGGMKKEFRNLNGRPILAETLGNFIKTGLFSYGVITCIPGSEDEVRERLTASAVKLDSLSSPLLFCSGGNERQDSVLFGLNFLSDNCPELLDEGIVLIHDGARPWASTRLIDQVAQGALKHAACAPVSPSVDAMKEISTDGIITGHLSRRKTVSVQTPQGFAFNEILAAHKRAAADGRHYIDDTEIFSRYEGDVYTVPGSAANKKITYPEDLEI